MHDRWRTVVLATVVAQIPFELRYTLFGLSNLQWTFIALSVVSTPALLRSWRLLANDRLVQAAALFVATQWFAAAYAPEFHLNAVKAAIRFSAGFLLLAIARITNKREWITYVWVIASGVAAAYALAMYVGFAAPWLFRTEEFYIGQTQRLSGSFEYPNTAAAYFAISLPIVWWSRLRPVLKWIFGFIVWCAIVLTFSKGALLALPLVVFGGALVSPANTAQWRPAAALVALGIGAYGVLLPFNPYLLERVNGPGVNNPIAAEYKTPWNYFQQQPDASDQIPLQIHNTGITKWRSRGWWRVAVAYRWWNMKTETFVKTRPLITELPRDVSSGETVEISTAVRTPSEPGKYVLVVELFGRNLDWFSQTGVKPTLIQADIQSAGPRTVGQADLSALYERGRTPGALTASVPRSSLWRAALKMFLDHPFGVGPDNFRLEYGKYLGASRWDTHIHSNSLCLELLTGSGIVGLAAFGLLIFSIRWRTDPAYLALAVFLVHGLVDVFVMTTPIYFAFWILAGTKSDQPPGKITVE
jgi:hypothetical protein